MGRCLHRPMGVKEEKMMCQLISERDMQQNCLRESVERIRQELTVTSLRKCEDPLSSQLRRCYDLVAARSSELIAGYYVISVRRGLRNWANEPYLFPSGAQMNAEIPILLAKCLMEVFSPEAERLFEQAGAEIRQVLVDRLAGDAAEANCAPTEMGVLDMKEFQLFWAKNVGYDVTQKAVRMVEAYQFGAKLKDTKSAENPRMYFRMNHLNKVMGPLEEQLKKDEQKLCQWLYRYFTGRKFLGAYRKALLQNLDNWVAEPENTNA